MYSGQSLVSPGHLLHRYQLGRNREVGFCLVPDFIDCDTGGKFRECETSVFPVYLEDTL